VQVNHKPGLDRVQNTTNQLGIHETGKGPEHVSIAGHDTHQHRHHITHALTVPKVEVVDSIGHQDLSQPCDAWPVLGLKHSLVAVCADHVFLDPVLSVAECFEPSLLIRCHREPLLFVNIVLSPFGCVDCDSLFQGGGPGVVAGKILPHLLPHRWAHTPTVQQCPDCFRVHDSALGIKHLPPLQATNWLATPHIARAIPRRSYQFKRTKTRTGIDTVREHLPRQRHARGRRQGMERGR